MRNKKIYWTLLSINRRFFSVKEIMLGAFRFFILPYSFFLIIACPEPPVEKPPRDTTINLQLKRQGITSIDLQISVADTSDTWTFGLSRNDSLVLTATVTASDTIVKDGGLTPATEYRYRAYWLEKGTAIDSSSVITAVTGDTTSHNFVWVIDTLGNDGSYLNDVAIIDENNVWVVGDIRANGEKYNAAHWNGSEWGLHKILFRLEYEGGNVIWTDQIVISSVYSLDNIVWFVAGGLTKFENGEWYYYEIPWPYAPGSGGMWGSSSSNLYFVGNNGSIVHYDGTNFERMESGTEVSLSDIDGTPDGEYCFVLGYTHGMTENTALELQDQQWVPFYESDGYYGSPDNPEDYGTAFGIGVWGDTVYFATSGFAGPSHLVKYNYLTGAMEATPLYQLYNLYFVVYDLIVNGPNDIFVVDKWGQIVHFNGLHLKMHRVVYARLLQHNFILTRADYKDGMFVMVGYNLSFEYAVVVRGYRSN